MRTSPQTAPPALALPVSASLPRDNEELTYQLMTVAAVILVLLSMWAF